MSKTARRVCLMLPAHESAVVGGAERQAGYLGAALAERGAEVTYLCRQGIAGSCDGMTVETVASRNPLARYALAVDYPLVMRALRRLQPDVIYTRVDSAYVGMAARYAHQAGSKLVWHIAHERDLQPHRLRSRRDLLRVADRKLFAYGARRADAIIGQARYQEPLLQQRFRRRCTAIIPNFHPEPPARAKTAGELRILWVANLKAAKRPEAFLNLARALRGEAGLRFVMIGAAQDPALHELVQREAGELENLDYLGARAPDEVASALAEAHLFVNTSRAEGFPNTFIEAWLNRCALISLDVDPDGALAASELGLVSGSEAQLKADVLELARNCELRKRLVAAGFEHARARHSMRNAQELAGLIEALADS